MLWEKFLDIEKNQREYGVICRKLLNNLGPYSRKIIIIISN
jgi:hypothetical protein